MLHWDKAEEIHKVTRMMYAVPQPASFLFNMVRNQAEHWQLSNYLERKMISSESCIFKVTNSCVSSPRYHYLPWQLISKHHPLYYIQLFQTIPWIKGIPPPPSLQIHRTSQVKWIKAPNRTVKMQETTGAVRKLILKKNYTRNAEVFTSLESSILSK